MTFWEEKQPPAVLKHSVLQRYLKVFASKTASRARGRRVVYVDAFAGTGRYSDGDPASPLLAMALSFKVAQFAIPDYLDCLFIERDRGAWETLVQVVPPERCRLGPIEEHLTELLEHARGQPLFMFIDPYGQPIPFDDLTKKVLGRPRGPGLATEVLLNFSIRALQRNAGRLLQSKQRHHADAVLHRFDRAMGGPWWHERGLVLAKNSGASDGEREEAERSIVTEYAELVRAATGYMPVSAPIWRSRWKEKRPFFHLLLFTAHDQGIWFYARALADAMDDYYEAMHRQQEDLFDRPEERRQQATRVIATNVRRLVVEHGSFTVLTKTLEVLNGALGDGGGKEVAQAVRDLARRGEIVVEGPTTASDIFKARVLPGTTTTLFD